MGGMNAFDDIRFAPGTVWENPGILRVVVLQPKQKGKVRARVIEVLDPERAQYGLDELETWPVEKFALCFVRCLVMGFKREAQAAGN